MTVCRIFTDNTGRRENRPEARESYDKLSVILICLNEEKDPGERMEKITGMPVISGRH